MTFIPTRREFLTAAAVGVALPLVVGGSDEPAQAIESRRCKSGLDLYRPMPQQVPFHKSKAPIRIIRGGQRSGTTTAAAVEVAKAVMFHKGAKRIHCVGYDYRHAAVMSKKLFFPGLFKTGGSLCPPLIVPDRFWDFMSVEVDAVILSDKATVHFHSSCIDNAKIGECDLLWIDGDTRYPEYAEKWIRRAKKTIWSTFPHSKNKTLVQLSLLAKLSSPKYFTLAHSSSARVHETVLSYQDNIHVPEEEKQKRLRYWAEDASPSPYAGLHSRNYGQYKFFDKQGVEVSFI